MSNKIDLCNLKFYMFTHAQDCLLARSDEELKRFARRTLTKMNSDKLLVKIDTVKEAYENFYDHAWAKEIRALTDDTSIEELCWDLFWSWKGIARTAFLPWLVIHTMTSFAESMDRMRVRKEHMQQLLNFVRDGLLPQLSSPTTKIEVCMGLDRLKKDLQNKSFPSLEGTFDEDEAWTKYLSVPEFRFSLVWSQRISFSALYHAYEDFMCRCLGLARREPDYQFWKYKTFKSEFAAAFGEPLMMACLGNDFVNSARLVRNALAHNGGREDNELKTMPHGYSLEKNVIQITASDVRQLYHSLKDNVLKLVTFAVTIPELKASVKTE